MYEGLRACCGRPDCTVDADFEHFCGSLEAHLGNPKPVLHGQALCLWRLQRSRQCLGI